MASFCSLNPILGLGCCPSVSSLNRKERFSHFSPKEGKFSIRNFREIPKVRQKRRSQASFECKGKNSDINDKQDGKDVSQATLIWRAIKLPIYSVALVPLTVGSAAAYLQTSQFSVRRYLALLMSSILIITWLNLSNDVYDFDTGADKNKKESVVNILGSRTGTLVAANLLLGSGFLGLLWVALEAGNIRSILLLLCAVMCGYMYQCPPFRLSYHGLGEPLCFAAFGPFATTAFYLMQISSREICYHHPLTSTIISASVLVGYTTTLVLFCSHFHQVEGDKAVGKFSPMVRVGRKVGSEVVKIAIGALYAFLFVLGIGDALPLASSVLCSLTLPIGVFIANYVQSNYNDNERIFMAKYYCVRLHTLFGAALAVGLVIARRYGKYVPKPIFS